MNNLAGAMQTSRGAHPIEGARLARLQSLDVLDTPPDNAFDAIAIAVASIANTPIGLVTLIDQDRQWFKARCGTALLETPRDISFCTHTIERGDAMVVEDTRLDPRFSVSPMVTGDPFVRFYAGFPLDVGGGMRVGTLCVLDTRPRQLTRAQLKAMQSLAHATAKWLVDYRSWHR